jgi:hypothetical protein
MDIAVAIQACPDRCMAGHMSKLETTYYCHQVPKLYCIADLSKGLITSIVPVHFALWPLKSHQQVFGLNGNCHANGSVIAD